MRRAPVVIAHRGASGYIPEHTLDAYDLAIRQGADFIEPDLVITADGVLVARHENELGATTDVAGRAEFAARETTKTIDGVAIAGWFTEDFSLAELKTLRARERFPALRAASARLDGSLEVPTFEEILELAARADRRIGVYPETKHPAHFRTLGLSLEQPLVTLLERHGYAEGEAFIQSLEESSLRMLARMTALPLVQLVDSARHRAQVQSIAAYAAAIGASKHLVIPCAELGRLGAPTTLVRDAHDAGLLVHAWTFRAENAFLPRELASSGDPASRGNLEAELSAFIEAGVDGYFTDHPDIGVRVRDAWRRR